MISSLLASDSVGMIYLRSNIDDDLFWVLNVHVWHSEGAKSETYWFGLYRGCVTSTWPKLNSYAQKLPSCKISGHFLHWVLFYSTTYPRIRTWLPLSITTYLISFLLSLNLCPEWPRVSLLQILKELTLSQKNVAWNEIIFFWHKIFVYPTKLKYWVK